MLGMTVRVDDGGLGGQLAEFSGQFKDFTDLWPEIAAGFFAIETELFDSEGATGASGAWAPLSPRYAEWKGRNYGALPILEREGALRASLTGPAASIEISPFQMTIGTDVPYAIVHQEGSPRRAVIDMSDDDDARIGHIAEEWADRRVAEIFR